MEKIYSLLDIINKDWNELKNKGEKMIKGAVNKAPFILPIW